MLSRVTAYNHLPSYTGPIHMAKISWHFEPGLSKMLASIDLGTSYRDMKSVCLICSTMYASFVKGMEALVKFRLGWTIVYNDKYIL